MRPGDPGVTSAAEALAAARAAGLKLAEPPGPEPADMATGYAIQDALIAATDSPVVGWKIGATSARAQAAVGVDAPFIGPLFGRWAVHSPAPVDTPAEALRIVECEFAFRMETDLPPRAAPYDDPAEVAAAAGALHAAIEWVDRRIATRPDAPFGGNPAWLAADAGCNGGFVAGPGRTDWRDLAVDDLRAAVAVDGAARSDGVAANALGGPLRALVWAAEHLRGRGIGLRAGEWVTTGLVTEVFAVDRGARVTADFEKLGPVEVHF